MWGNMHWGHAVSHNLIYWKEVEPTIYRDPMGHIFSGSTVIDKEGTAGYARMRLSPFIHPIARRMPKRNVWLIAPMAVIPFISMRRIQF